ncbi:MAG: hypothetical protein SRB2_01932 [Desulfobacteraceae bacterium Eth-SRB2]|nr:MAG: hypothetical protein SRB2_01932 [Desulfobacteraceae bacterium Eth-SRB2]
MCLSQSPIAQAPNGRSSGQSMLLSARTTEKNLIVIKKNTRLNPHKDKNGYPSSLSHITGFNVGSYSEELEGYPERSVYIKIDCQELSAPTYPMTESQILGPGLVREILYRAFCGTQAPVLYSLAMHSGAFSQVAHALKIMQSDYAAKLDVEKLANTACMSASAFHRAFKDITSDSPMQYLKKVRLTKAKNLMVQENIKAYIAADKVGYESSSQFSREFKRYFGQTPAEMMRELRAA